MVISSLFLSSFAKASKLFSWPCPSGYHFEVVRDFELNLFAKNSTCQGGFGFCFGTTITLTFDCVKNVPDTTGGPSDSTLEKIGYYPNHDSADVIISQIDESNIVIYISNEVKSSPSHKPSDFDYFDTGSIVLGNKIELQEGIYPKVELGNFYTYTIPFTYVD